MLRRTTCALLACLPVAALAQAPAGKPAPVDISVLAGGYEISNAAGDRKCLVLLRPASAPGGYAIGFTAQCKMTLPIMSSVGAWTADPASNRPRIRFRNAAGAVLLDFSDTTDDGNVQAQDAEKALYTLKPTAGASIATRGDSVPARPSAPTPPPTSIPAATMPRDAPAMSRAAGGYVLQRDKGRETGCHLTLHDGPANDGKAELATGCADKGLTQFSPAGWRISTGTLWLTGGKGQRLSFERNRRGGWDKGPGQGEALSLLPK